MLLKKVITVRTTQEQHDQLEDLARLYRMQSGEPWTVADLVRDAIREKLEREKPEGDTHRQKDALRGTK